MRYLIDGTHLYEIAAQRTVQNYGLARGTISYVVIRDCVSAVNSQTHGDDGLEDGRVNDSDGGTTVTEELIAHVLGRAHREVEARNAPDEARAILHVARSFADVLGEINPRFDRAWFIRTSTESIYTTVA